MSLVSEALRKARQRGDGGHPPGAVVPPSLVLPPRRYRSGLGIAPLVLVAVAAGLGGAAGVWWAAGRQQPASAPASAVAPAQGDHAAPPAVAGAPDAASRPPDAAPEAPSLAVAVAPEAAATPVPPPVEPEPAWTGERRTHDVLIDADLRYAKLHLDYLVHRPGSPFGRVNGHDVIIGSIVDGFTVEEITADYIKLSDRRNTVILRVR